MLEGKSGKKRERLSREGKQSKVISEEEKSGIEKDKGKWKKMKEIQMVLEDTRTDKRRERITLSLWVRETFLWLVDSVIVNQNMILRSDYYAKTLIVLEKSPKQLLTSKTIYCHNTTVLYDNVKSSINLTKYTTQHTL